jgi:hypothetical protein
MAGGDFGRVVAPKGGRRVHYSRRQMLGYGGELPEVLEAEVL